MSGSPPFRVALTADFYDSHGALRYRDVGLDRFTDQPGLVIERLAEHRPELSAAQLAGYQGVIVLTPRVTQASLDQADELVALGRFGVGYDSVDVEACTERDVALFITAGAVDWSVAEATVGWMLSLAHRAAIKDRLVRQGRWDERSQHMGSELRERTVGVIGLGGIGRAVVQLLAGFRMRPALVYDPFLTSAQAASLGVIAVSLETLLEQADFVTIHCPLTPGTRNLIGPRELARMKPTAFLINTARGGIVDEDALDEALERRELAGAAFDCFRDEPLREPPRLARHENVLLAPHAIAWSDELFRDIGRAVCQGMVDVAHGREPRGLVNRAVWQRPGFQSKLRRFVYR